MVILDTAAMAAGTSGFATGPTPHAEDESLPAVPSSDAEEEGGNGVAQAEEVHSSRHMRTQLERQTEVLEQMGKLMSENLKAVAGLTKRIEGVERGEGSKDERSSRGDQGVRRDPQRMTERRGFTKVPEFQGRPEAFEDWRFRMRGFLSSEGIFSKLLDWVDKLALADEDEHGNRVNSMVKKRAKRVKEGSDPWSMPWDDEEEYEVEFGEGVPAFTALGENDKIIFRRWDDPEIAWYGENLYQCLQASLQGTHMTNLLRNLECITPSAARGFEAWFRLMRDFKGVTGPRLIRLAAGIFSPKRAQMTEVASALEAWEADIREFELSGQRLGSLLKTFGLMRLIPQELEKDLIRLKHQLTNYTKSRTWVLDQVATRRDEGKTHAPVHQLEEGDLCNELHHNGEAEPSTEEILQLGRAAYGKGKAESSAKGNSKGGQGFQGECHYCGKYGHRLNECRLKDRDMNWWRTGQKGKGEGKGTGMKGGGFKGGGKTYGGGYGRGGKDGKGKGGKGGMYALAEVMAELGKPSASIHDGWNGGWQQQPGLYSLKAATPPPPPGFAHKTTYAALAEDSDEEAEMPIRLVGDEFPVVGLAAAEASGQRRGSNGNGMRKKMKRVPKGRWRRTAEDLLDEREVKEHGVFDDIMKNKGKINDNLQERSKESRDESHDDLKTDDDKRLTSTRPALCPIFLKPLDEEVSGAAEIFPLDYKRAEHGWTCVKAVPDTGAHASVAPPGMAAGHAIRPSEGSLKGQEFVAASGDTIPNQGEQVLPMQSAEGIWTRQRWQIAPVTRPLLSIGEVCDDNHLVVFGRAGGAIMNLETGCLRKFPRVKGSYEMEMWLPPSPAQHGEGELGFLRPGLP